MFEIAEVVNETKRNADNNLIELLSSSLEKTGFNLLFLKKEKINIVFNDELLAEGHIFDFSLNKEYKIPISIRNSDEIMAKRVEVGIVLPAEIIITKTPNIASVSSKETENIVRFKEEYIQAGTDQKKGELSITFLQPGKFNIRAFIKGENIKQTVFRFIINVVN
jgi:hypothetical protein